MISMLAFYKDAEKGRVFVRSVNCILLSSEDDLAILDYSLFLLRRLRTALFAFLTLWRLLSSWGEEVRSCGQ